MTRKVLKAVCCPAVLIGLNVWIAARLFETEYTPWMHSIEGAYIGISRWLQGHWTDLGWFPLWYAGIPFENAYPPLLHVLVAAVAQIARASVARTYHFVTAAMYCLGPVAMFWLVHRLSRSKWQALIAAWTFSVLSFSAFLMPSVAGNLNHGVWGARRIQTLIAYGEGPHVTSLTLLLVALAAVHAALESRTGWRTVIAIISMAAVALTNWLGAMALALGVLALALARKAPPLGRMAIMAVLAYAIAAPWIPPTNIAAIQRNAQQVGEYQVGQAQYFYIAAWLAATIAVGLLLRKTRLGEGARFAVLFLLLVSVPPLGAEWFGVYPLPQPHRYHLEMEAAISIAIGILFGWKGLKHKWVRTAAAAAMLALAVVQAPHWKAQVDADLPPFDITKTVEWAEARWLAEHYPGKRVFAAGSSRFWLNAFSDNPQLGGGFDQGRTNPAIADVTFAVPYTRGNGQETVSLLKAFGVHAIIVGGERSRDSYRDFKDPAKFSGVLPELWRDGDDAIYGIPTPSDSLAHVVGEDDLVSGSSIDPAAVGRFVAALENTAYGKAQFRWNGPGRASIHAEVLKGQVVHVQVNGDPGWKARVRGAACAAGRDALGLLVLEPACDGQCAIDLVYDGGAQAKATYTLSRLGAIACILIILWGARKGSAAPRARASERSA